MRAAPLAWGRAVLGARGEAPPAGADEAPPEPRDAEAEGAGEGAVPPENEKWNSQTVA